MWNSVVLDFGNEETVNFGPRIESADSNHLYEVHTLATISSSVEVQKNPLVSSGLGKNYVVIALDNCISIFVNECRQIFTSLQYDSKVECMSISDDEQLFILGEQNGTLHSIYIPKMKNLAKLKLFSPNDSGHSYGSVQFISHGQGNTDLAVLSSAGDLLIMSIDLESIEKAAILDDWATVTKVITQGAQQKSNLNDLLPGLKPANLIALQNKIGFYRFDSPCILIGFGQNEFEQFPFLEAGTTIKKVATSESSSYIFVLDNQDHIHQLSSVTLHVVRSWDIENVLDFTLAETYDLDGNVEKQELVFLIADNNSDFCKLQIRSLPSFELCYTLQLSSFSWIIGSLANQEDFLILEAEERLNDESLLESVRLRALSQSAPETRLAQLLRKREFSEAENLAKLFCLDVEQIYKAQISHLLNVINPWNHSNSEVFSCKQIKFLLKKIKDLKFVLECCMQAALPSPKDTKDLLLFARKQAELSNHPLATTWVENTTYLIQKLDTFLMLYPKENDWLLWFEFSPKKVQQLFLELLKSSQTDKAFMFWERLKGEVSTMKPTDLELILQALPDKIPSRELFCFFQGYFLPQIIAFSPECIDVLAEWMMNRIQWLEIDISEKEQWPKNGLMFLKILPEVCENLMSLCQIGGILTTVELDIHILQRKSYTPNSPFCALLSMINDLEQLQTLNDKYDCQIPLEEFRKEDKTLVIFLLLDRLVGKKLFEESVNQFLRNYTKQYNLDLDTVFTQYIEDLVSTYTVGWRDVWEEESLWEQRALTIFSNIFNPDLRMEALLEMVSHSPLPWSEPILQTVQAQLLSNHSKNCELEDQVRISYFKSVLLKYNLHTLTTDDYDQPYFASNLLKFVLRQGKPSALEDALQISKGFGHISELDVHFEYLKILLEQLKIDDFLDQFANLKVTDSLIIGGRILIYTFSHLNSISQFSSDPHLKQLEALTQGCLSMCKDLNEKFPSKFPPLPTDMEYLNIVRSFQKEFKIYIKPQLVSSTSKKWDIFHQHMEILLSKLQNESQVPGAVEGISIIKPSIMSTVKLYRMAAILGLSSEEACGRLSIALAEAGESIQSLEICREIIGTNVSSEECLKSLILHLLSHLTTVKGEHASILTSIHQLSTNLLLNCRSEKLLENIQLSEWSRLLCYLSALDTHSSSSDEVAHADCYNRWRFSTLYRDQGLRIEFGHLLPILVKCITASKLCTREVQEQEMSQKNIEAFSLYRQVLLHLRSKGQEIASLQFLLTIYDLNSDNFPEEMISSQKQVFKGICKSLISKIVSQRKVDLNAALGFLCLQDEIIGKEIIKELWLQFAKDCNRVKWIARVGMEYGLIGKIPSLSEKLCHLYKISFWMSRLTKLQITIKNPESLENPDSARKILDDIFPLANLDLILEFAQEFGIDRDPALLSYIEFLLTGPLISDWGLTNTQASADQLQELKTTFARADEVISRIEIKSGLEETLCAILGKINCYCYEMIEWLLKKILNLGNFQRHFEFEKGLTVLNFLQIFKRLEQPIEYEFDIWLSDNPQHDHLPSIASVRLPYHLVSQENKKDKWKVITQEVYASNVELWINIGPKLQLDPDQLLVTATQNEVNSWLERHHIQGSKKSTFENCLQKPPLNPSGQGSRQDSQFLTILQGLILKIKNLDMATATASWIVKRLPPGANKVAVAQASVALASHWMSQSPRCMDASVKVERLQGIYHRLAIEQELVRFSLDTQEHLALAQNPSQLIHHLLESLGTGGLFRMDQGKLFRAIEEIASIGGCNLLDIYQSRLEKWMPKGDVGDADEDATMTICLSNFNIATCLPADDKESSLNLNRTISLLREIYNADIFIHQAKAILENLELTNNLERAQGLRSLFAVADYDKIRSISENYEPETLWEYLQHSVYIARLEALHMYYTMNMFAQCNKEDLVENILVSHGHNPKALLLSSSLCSQYKIWKQVFWDIILNNMTDLNLVENLRCVLWQIKSVPCLWHISSLIKAWECLLRGSILAASSSNDVNKAMLDAYTSFLNCPCYLDLNKENLANDFEVQGQHFLALCCLLVNEDPFQDQEKLLKEFLVRHSSEKLKKELDVVMKIVPTYKLIAFSKAMDLLSK